MDSGQAVRYKGKPLVFGDRYVDPGTKGEVIGVHRIEEIWFAVQWEGMSRPTFHLATEIEAIN